MLKHLMSGSSLSSFVVRQSENEDGADDAVDFVALREAFREAKGRDIKVSDKVLGMAIENNKEWDNLEEEQTYAFIELVEQAANRVSIVDPGISVLVEKMDDAFFAEVSECLEAIKKNKTTAVDIYAQFHRLYSLEELNGMPFGGSDEDSVKGTNYRADKVKTKDRVTGVEMTTVWTNDLVSSTPFGKDVESRLDDISKEIKTAGTSTRAEYKNKSKKYLSAQKATLTQSRNGLRSMFKRAINTHHQFEAVRGMPLVELEWMEGTKTDGIWVPNEFGKGTMNVGVKNGGMYVSRSPKPLWIMPKGKASDGRDISITQLVNFDVMAALVSENGGTMGDLLDTLSKGTSEVTATDGDGSTMSEEEALATIQRSVNYLNKKDNMANVRRILADKKHDERKDLLENINSMYHLVAPIVRAYKDDIEALTASPSDVQKVA